MSIFKSNKFFRIIKHFVLCLPLMFVLGTSIYTIVNPNAKDSYSGTTQYEIVYKYQTNEVNSIYDLKQGRIYKLTLPNTYTGVLVTYATYMQGYRTSDELMTLSLDGVAFQMIDISADSVRAGFYDGETFVTNTIYKLPFVYFVYHSGFNIDYLSYVSIADYNEIEGVIFDNSGTLDNSFEYGMYKFNQIGFGAFDFVSWFNGIFTTSVNNVYLNFINSYLNYYLMVEIVYFVPWVIHKFVHFAYDLGDYFTDGFKRRKEDD